MQWMELENYEDYEDYATSKDDNKDANEDLCNF